MTTYRILAHVSGGVTGTREAWLKRDGRIREFYTREAADDEAARLNSTMNHQYSTASFRYTVVPDDEE